MGTILTETDLIEAIMRAQDGQGPSGALTVLQISERTGLSVQCVREKLRKLPDIRVVRVNRRSLDGVIRPVPAYYIEKEKEK